jgi:rubrerythrin
MTAGKRPPRRKAAAAVRKFLAERVSKEAAARFNEASDWKMIEDGDDGFAFWMISSDTTSYVSHDLRIEWYGTAWPDGECSPCGHDFGGDRPKLCPHCKAPTAFCEPCKDGG